MRRPIIGVHDNFAASIRDTVSTKDLINDRYNTLFREQNDVIFDGINSLGKEDVSGLVRVAELRKVAVKRLDFSAPLSGALRSIPKGSVGIVLGRFFTKKPMQDALG